MVNTLVITSYRDDLVQGKIGNGVEELLGQKVDVAEFGEIEFLLGNAVEMLWQGKSLTSYNKIIMYGGVTRLLRIAHPLAVALQGLGVDVFTSSAENYRGVDKLTQYVQMSLAGFSIPKTYFANAENLLKHAETQIGFPMIVKDILNSRGENNFLIKNQSELDRLKDKLTEDRYVAKKYIENDGDIRVLMNDQGDHFAYKRTATDGSHLNNIAQGAEVMEYTPSKELVDECARLLTCMNLHLGGIDVIVTSDAHYFLEANVQPVVFHGEFAKAKQRVVANLLTRAQ